MSYYAGWLKKGNHLNGKHLEKARKCLNKYATQLCKIAEAKGKSIIVPQEVVEWDKCLPITNLFN